MGKLNANLNQSQLHLNLDNICIVQLVWMVQNLKVFSLTLRRSDRCEDTLMDDTEVIELSKD